MDLGATPMQAIRKVVIPEIMPGIMAGALMAFTMSIDDFVISYFTAGNGVTNLSIEVYSMAKRGIRPTVNALATIMVSLILVSVLVANNYQLERKGRSNHLMKKLMMMFIASFILLLTACSGDTRERLYVYNVGEYIDREVLTLLKRIQL